MAQIVLNRPERLNAVIESLYVELFLAIERSNGEADVRVIVITGAGRAFCVGADLKEHRVRERTSLEQRSYAILANDICRAIHQCPKPIIAAVNGFAAGAGAELAISSDFVLMKQSAQIWFPELRLGTFVGGGATGLLPQLVGLTKARELLFTGEKVDGPEAVRIGLATAAFSDDTFDSEVNEFAMRLGEGAPVSMAFAKSHLNSPQRDYESRLTTEMEALRTCMYTADWAEGLTAFAEDRKPDFQGN